ncbi:hypothetical protein ACIP5Y_25230 [Nocardia sp. NPDC088792]|uniref:hypothetical protein n=1 Tax=Nocardia sp. NPDC088792 TaxID=3364332 RepID=UPI00381C3BF6
MTFVSAWRPRPQRSSHGRGVTAAILATVVSLLVAGLAHAAPDTGSALNSGSMYVRAG